VANTVVFDCTCQHGFYRIVGPTPGPDNFTCAECTVDDYCYNNSRFNCSDERMRALPGSDSSADCVCADSFHTNADNAECLECAVDHFCVNCSQTACAAAQWTNNLTRQEVCLCQPGLRAQEDGCVPCGAGWFCQGNDFAEACRAHSETLGPSAEAYEDCLCEAGYSETRHGATHEQCVACVGGETFRRGAGNELCAQCTQCQTEGVYTNVWCETKANASFDACVACGDGEEYTQQACAEFSNALCVGCHECDYASEFEWQACQVSQDQWCQAFKTSSATCAASFYRGVHTREKDSECQPCLYNDTRLNGQSLHSARTPSAEYNNTYS